jgi:hypothetical protein
MVRIEFERHDYPGAVLAYIKWPNGEVEEVYWDNIGGLDWQPPWEPTIDEPAYCDALGALVIVRGIHAPYCWVQGPSGQMHTYSLEFLREPKGA